MAEVLPYAPLPIEQDGIRYAYGPHSSPRPEVRPGHTDEFELDHSTRYLGNSRRLWIHTPHGHHPDEPAAVIFFNDGWLYLDPDGDVRAGTVLDNLAADGAIPPAIGVFVDPGIHLVDGVVQKNRNVEYDAFDARYADFLLHEVLPLVESRFAVSPEAGMRAICGGSSGGNAAFTAAWMRPESIGKVIAFNSSFAQMPGGNPYPRLLAEAPRHPLRIFLHAAHRDLNWNHPTSNWFAENLKTAAALAENGYDFRLVVGDGGHSPNHGGVLLRGALRWLWRDPSAD